MQKHFLLNETGHKRTLANAFLKALFELKIHLVSDGEDELAWPLSFAHRIDFSARYAVDTHLLSQNAKYHIIVMTFADFVIIVGLDQGSPGSRRS